MERMPEHPKKATAGDALPNLHKDPQDWVSAEEAMTGAQAVYLKTLCEQAQQVFDPSLSKARASQRIDELKRKKARSRGAGGSATR